MVNVTRNANGISLNAGHREFLFDSNNKPMQFQTKTLAIKFLNDHGVTDLEGIKFPTVK